MGKEAIFNELLSLVSPSGSNGGWRGNGNDAPSWYGSNASSWKESLAGGDPRYRWAVSTVEKIPSGETSALRFLCKTAGIDPLSPAVEEALTCVSEAFDSPDDPLSEEAQKVVDLLHLPWPPYTEDQLKADFLEWKAATGFPGNLRNTTVRGCVSQIWSKKHLLVVLNADLRGDKAAAHEALWKFGA